VNGSISEIRTRAETGLLFRGTMRARISARALIKVGIFVTVYTGFGGTLYFLNGRLQELGLLCVLCVFVYTAGISAINVRERDFNWSAWFIVPILVVLYAMLAPAITFAVNNNIAPFKSIISTRDFLAILFAPALYFSYRCGLSIEELQKPITLALGMIMLSYIFHYYRIDLPSAYRSPIAAVKLMITYDEWRGYRLKGPDIAQVFCSLCSMVLAYRTDKTGLRVFWILVALATGWAWYLIQARAMFAGMIVGLVLYHLWFARRNRMPLFYLGAPILVLIVSAAMFQFVTTMHEHDTARYKSIKQATEFLAQNPVFGMGKDNEKLPERLIMNPQFFSSDIGIIGVAFRLGILGATLLMCVLIFTLARAVITNWLVIKRTGRSDVIFYFFISVALGDLINIFLSAVRYIKVPGILTLAIVIAFTAIYRHQLGTRQHLTYP